MQIASNDREHIDDARQLVQNGQLAEAAAIYQKMFDRDPANQAVVGPLLTLYRKLKEYHKELAVLNSALEEYDHRGKAAEAKWLKTHPKAARAGRSVLKQLERSGEKMSAFGVNPAVQGWLKRKEFVTNRIAGRKTVRKKKVPKPPPQKLQTQKSPSPKPQAQKPQLQKPRPQKSPPKDPPLKKPPPAPPVTQMHPSLFVITLIYRVSLEKIDSLMSRHMTYLHKHFEQGDFLVSGRQVPRTGGVILARAKNRTAMERIVKEDPFVKKHYATADIVEFSASQVAKDLKAALHPRKNHKPVP